MNTTNLKGTHLKDTYSRTAGLKVTVISAAIALAMGLSAAQLHAQQGQGAEDLNPSISTDGQVNQPVEQPADGEQLLDEVNRTDVNRSTTLNENRSAIDRDSADAEDFLETASAKGIAEINTARIALEEGSPAIRSYASKIIEDHTATNNELKALALRTDLEVADEATLVDRAKALILSAREGQSFDEAYVENQIAAHEDSIELFERAANSNIPEISTFARGKLPALQEHLRMANALKTQVSSL